MAQPPIAPDALYYALSVMSIFVLTLRNQKSHKEFKQEGNDLVASRFPNSPQQVQGYLLD